jgi:hypothetical protein
MRSAVLFSLLLGGLVMAQPNTLVVKGNQTVDVYKIVRLKAENPAANAAIVWDVLDEGADAIEIDGELFFTGPPGKYRIVCTEITIVGTKPAVRRTRTTVEIVGNGPVPPGPPSPPNPGPVDPLLGKLRAVFQRTDENHKNLLKLKAIYHIGGTETCYDKNLPSLIELYNVVARASGSSVPLPILQAEREIIAAELRAKLPTKDQALTDELRKQVASEFSRVAAVLGELAK